MPISYFTRRRMHTLKRSDSISTDVHMHALHTGKSFKAKAISLPWPSAIKLMSDAHSVAEASNHEWKLRPSFVWASNTKVNLAHDALIEPFLNIQASAPNTWLKKWKAFTIRPAECTYNRMFFVSCWVLTRLDTLTNNSSKRLMNRSWRTTLITAKLRQYTELTSFPHETGVNAKASLQIVSHLQVWYGY